MVKIIKRTTDNKFLQSLELDTWVDNSNDALIMTFKECETIKENLLNTYSQEQIKEMIDYSKSKPVSKEERKELLNLLKNK
jgi:hypothetical protein